VQRILREALDHSNPLSQMGYARQELPDHGRGGSGRT
jgi:hypothetical protein